MDVKYFGFNLFNETNLIPLESYFKFIEQQNYISTTNSGNELRVYVDTISDEKFYKGLIVTVKDQKRFCKFSDKHSSMKIEVENLKGNDKLLEFNFFVIDKMTGLGIYQHYHQSCALNVFGRQIKMLFNQYRASTAETDLTVSEVDKGSKLSKNEKKLIRSKYNDRLLFSPLFKKENIEKLLSQCNSINSFEFEYSYLTENIKAATPLSKFVERKVEKLTFNKENGVKELASRIGAFVANIRPKRGKIFVEDSNGEQYPLKIFDMPDSFGKENYDSLVLKLDGLEINNFANHNYFNDLTSIFHKDEYSHIFGMEIA